MKLATADFLSAALGNFQVSAACRGYGETELRFTVGAGVIVRVFSSI
jgi:hypothetical protein